MHCSSRLAPGFLRLSALVICATISFPACDDGDDQVGSFFMAEPDTITFHVVHREVPPPCSGVAGPDELVFPHPDDYPTSCVIVGPAEVDATDVVDAKVVKSRDPWRREAEVRMKLSEEAAVTFDDMIRRTAGGRIAIVVDGRLSELPTYKLDPMFRGVVGVSLPPGEAEILADRLQRTASP